MRRRDFIRYTSATAIPILAGGFSMQAFANSPLLDMLSEAETDRVLIIVQLNGGNDGLNTVIPLDQYSNLAAARANILLPEPKILRMTNATGLHPSMGALHSLYEDGKVRVLQNVGYNPANQSHFRSTDIWLTAPSNITKVIPSGWVGRYLQTLYPGYPETKYDHPPALQIGAIASLGFMGENSTPMGITVSSPASFEYLANGIIDTSIPKNAAELELKYIRNMSVLTGDYSDVIRNAVLKGNNMSNLYPGEADKNDLAQQFKIIAKLISGGLKTRIFMVSMGGFDTHDGQVDKTSTGTLTGHHANLLGKLSVAINAFQDDLKLLKIEDRVAGFTFSEFGRRIRSNDSYGTDHGAAAPMFVFGAKVVPGILGPNPQIPKSAGVGDVVDAAPEHDFRNIYATILKDWFGVDQQGVIDIMDSKNDVKMDLAIFREGDIPVDDKNKIALYPNYPNPFKEYTTIKFKTLEGQTSLVVYDTAGKLVRVLLEKNMSEGVHEVTMNRENLAAGIYFCHLQNSGQQASVSMVVTT